MICETPYLRSVKNTITSQPRVSKKYVCVGLRVMGRCMAMSRIGNDILWTLRRSGESPRIFESYSKSQFPVFDSIKKYKSLATKFSKKTCEI